MNNIFAKKELERLLEGNKHFINGNCSCTKRNLETLHKYAHGQEPKTIILSCSDSRIIPELIFDCGIGELFVVRTAGGTAGISNDIVESVEFAITKFQSPLLLLIGHDDCGAVQYAKEHFCEVDVRFNSIIASLAPILADNEDAHHDEITIAHTQELKKVLLNRSEIIATAVKKNELEIVCAHFKFDTGEVVIV